MLSRGSENIFTSKQTRALSTLDKLDEAYYLYAYDIREEVSHPQLQESGKNTQIPVRQQIRKTSKSNRQFLHVQLNHQTRRNVQRNNKFLASNWKTSTGEIGELTKLQQTPTKKTEAFIINRAAEYRPRSCTRLFRGRCRELLHAVYHLIHGIMQGTPHHTHLLSDESQTSRKCTQHLPHFFIVSTSTRQTLSPTSRIRQNSSWTEKASRSSQMLIQQSQSESTA